jgi:hypothetical protein
MRHRLHDLLDLVERDGELLGDLLVTLVRKILVAFLEHPDGHAVAGRFLLELDQKALAQVSRADADRIEALDGFQHGFHRFDRGVEVVCDRFHFAGEVTHVINAPQQVFPDLHLDRRQRCQMELLHQVIHQSDGRGLGMLDILLGLLPGQLDLVVVFVVENGVPVDRLLLLSSISFSC